MIIDKDIILWLVSTAPQVLAALAGLSFAALTFKVGSIDERISRDYTRVDLLGFKKSLYQTYKWVIIPSIGVIAIDFVYICGAEWVVDDNVRFYCMIGFFALLNLICLIMLCVFPLILVNPAYESYVVDKLVKETEEELKPDVQPEEKPEEKKPEAKKPEKKGIYSVRVRPTVPRRKYLLRFQDLEGKLYDLFIETPDPLAKSRKRNPALEAIEALKSSRVITDTQHDDLLKLTKIKDYVKHQPDVDSVGEVAYNKLDAYVKTLEALGKGKK